MFLNALSCGLQMRKISHPGYHGNVVPNLLRACQQKEEVVREISAGIMDDELDREKERVIKKIYQEDQDEIDGLQTTTEKRRNVHRHVQEFLVARDMEEEDNRNIQQYSGYEKEQQSDISRQAIEVEQHRKNKAADGVRAHALFNIRLELLENGSSKEEESFKVMMLKKFAEYDKI